MITPTFHFSILFSSHILFLSLSLSLSVCVCVCAIDTSKLFFRFPVLRPLRFLIRTKTLSAFSSLSKFLLHAPTPFLFFFLVLSFIFTFFSSLLLHSSLSSQVLLSLHLTSFFFQSFFFAPTSLTLSLSLSLSLSHSFPVSLSFYFPIHLPQLGN